MSSNRPFGVSFLSILLIIGGIFDVVGSIIFLLNRNNEDVQRVGDVTSGQLTGYAIAGIVIGVVVILVAFALRNGSNFARYLIGFIALLRLATLIWLVIAYHSVHWYNAFWPMALYALVFGYLFFDEDAKRFFEARA